MPATYVTKRDLHAALQQMKKEILQEIFDGFRAINENLVHDFRGIFNDRTEVLKDKVYAQEKRIVRIEHFLRLP